MIARIGNSRIVAAISIACVLYLLGGVMPAKATEESVTTEYWATVKVCAASFPNGGTCYESDPFSGSTYKFTVYLWRVTIGYTPPLVWWSAHEVQEDQMGLVLQSTGYVTSCNPSTAGEAKTGAVSCTHSVQFCIKNDCGLGPCNIAGSRRATVRRSDICEIDWFQIGLTAGTVAHPWLIKDAATQWCDSTGSGYTGLMCIHDFNYGAYSSKS